MLFNSNLVDSLKNNKTTLEELSEVYFINVKKYEEQNIVLLSYNQINSPKQHPFVIESRGCILDLNNFDFVARPFDRFFNYGECNNSDIVDFSDNTLEAREKIDGSIIKIYFNKKLNNWYVATNGTAFAEAEIIQGSNITFKDIIYENLNCKTQEEFNTIMKDMDINYTYVLEVVSKYNQIVTEYVFSENDSYLYLLGIRHKDTGEYLKLDDNITKDIIKKLNLKLGQTHNVNDITIEELLYNANNLDVILNDGTKIKEGYVIYKNNKPICKIKSDLYVTMHHLRGNNNPTWKNLIELVLVNESDEYGAYFKQYKTHLDKIENVYKDYLHYQNTFNLTLFEKYFKEVYKFGDDNVKIKKEFSKLLFETKKIIESGDKHYYEINVTLSFNIIDNIIRNNMLDKNSCKESLEEIVNVVINDFKNCNKNRAKDLKIENISNALNVNIHHSPLSKGI